MNLFRLSCAFLLILALSSCGYIYGDDGLIKSKKYDYVTAKQAKDLKLPDELKHKSRADYTVLPNIGIKGSKAPLGKSLSQTAPIQLLAVLENTRVDRDANVPAVLIMDKLEFIWQTAEFFLKDHNVKVSVIDKENRTILSNWIPIQRGGIWIGLDGSDDVELIRAKYKITVTASDIRGEHRLSVERTESQYRDDDDEKWQDRRITWQESADMMNLMLSYYDTRIRVQHAKRQRAIMAGFKVELGQDSSGNAALITTAKEDLIWQKIPKVMKELGMKIIDKDERQKTYFLQYEEVQEGFFASLFDETVSSLPLESGSYQIVLTENGEQKALTLKNGQGDALEAAVVVKLFPELSRLFGDRR